MVAYARQDDQYQLHTLQVFTVEEGVIVRTTVYQDPEVFRIFDLPTILRDRDDLRSTGRYISPTRSPGPGLRT